MISLLAEVSEPSKVPFYVAGGVFVGWAVVLAAVGLTVPAFPYNKRGYTVVIAISMLLAATAIAMAIATSK
ncbi:MAG: hypothetical protein ACJ764_15260 [Solirubrobacteraceae bacterium]